MVDGGPAAALLPSDMAKLKKLQLDIIHSTEEVGRKRKRGQDVAALEEQCRQCEAEYIVVQNKLNMARQLLLTYFAHYSATDRKRPEFLLPGEVAFHTLDGVVVRRSLLSEGRNKLYRGTICVDGLPVVVKEIALRDSADYPAFKKEPAADAVCLAGGPERHAPSARSGRMVCPVYHAAHRGKPVPGSGSGPQCYLHEAGVALRAEGG